MKALSLILGIPLLISVFVWIISAIANSISPQVIEKGGELIGQAAIPWWISVIQFLVSIPIIGAILTLVFIFILARSGSLEG